MKITGIYDNGGKTLDRYTVVTDEPWGYGANIFLALGLSINPTHPQGFSLWTCAMPGRHLGKKVRLESLPENIQKHIAARLAE